MNIDQFWELNDSLPSEDAPQTLAKRLSALKPAEIAEYQEHFDRVFASAYKWSLWGAAYIIDGGCSDDGFIDFRYGLISRGRKIFESAIADPETLVDVASDDGEGYIPNEEFGYVAQRVYEEKTGSRIPDNNVEHPTDPSGDNWDFDDEEECVKRLPRLWSQFGA